MSSVQSVVASSANGARFFVNPTLNPTIYTAAGVSSTATLAAGTVVRDMGKTIRTPSAAAVGAVTTQLVLRKVALASNGATTGLSAGIASSFVGFSESNLPSNIGAVVFYVNLLGGQWVSTGV